MTTTTTTVASPHRSLIAGSGRIEHDYTPTTDVIRDIMRYGQTVRAYGRSYLRVIRQTSGGIESIIYARSRTR